MSKSIFGKPSTWIVLASTLMVIAILLAVQAVRRAERDAWPWGESAEIEHLAERTDLNILFIVIDTLRADRLGAYGYARDTSPNLGRLADSGVRFAHHLAQSSWTKASMASMWTAMYPLRNGVTRFDDVVPDRADLPAEVLQRAGYHTVGIFRNGWVAPTFGFDQGFDVYTRPAPRPIPSSVRQENPTLTTGGTDADAVAAATEFLRTAGNRKWLLYLHLMDVHEYLYDEASALYGGRYTDIYDNSIRWVDRVVGVLLDELTAQGYRNRTIVVVVADHGEAFREHGFEGHARRVFRETTETPFILSLPFRLENGLVVSRRTRNIDVWPTLFALLGIDGSSGVDGRSLIPDVLESAAGASSPEAEGIGFAHLDQHWGQPDRTSAESVAYVDGPFRYVRSVESGRPIERLFDRRRDQREIEDVAADSPEALERMRAAVEAHLESSPAWGNAPHREIDELELNQLRALGYALP